MPRYLPAQLPEPAELLPDVNPPCKNANAWPGAVRGWDAKQSCGACTRSPADARAPSAAPWARPWSLRNLHVLWGGWECPLSPQFQINWGDEPSASLAVQGVTGSRLCASPGMQSSPLDLQPCTPAAPARFPAGRAQGVAGTGGALAPCSETGRSPWQPGRDGALRARRGRPVQQPVGCGARSRALGG